MNNLKVSFLILVSLVFLLSVRQSNISKNNELYAVLQTVQDSVKWAAPASANKLINPYEANDENIEIGKRIYRKHCRSCHGKTGDGQGVGAADLLTTVTNFTNPALFEQTDGSMFWKISEGRNEMEPYSNKIDEEDIWLVILYIKTFSSESSKQ